MTSTTTRRWRGGLAALIAIPVLAIGLAGCSSAAPDSSAGGQTPAAGTQSLADWQRSFAQCVRD